MCHWQQLTAIRRQAIRSACEKELGARHPEDGFNSWQEVFDESVYKGNGGTRMLGSCKVKYCMQCKSKKTAVLSIREEDALFKKFESKSAMLDPHGNRTRCYSEPLKMKLQV